MVDVVTQAAISVKKEDRLYQFYCANNSNLGELYDVLQEMRAYVYQRITDAEKAQVTQSSQPTQEPPKEG